MKLFIESEHKMFLTQYKAFFDAMQNLGIHFFKIELILRSYSKDSVINFAVEFSLMELAQFVIIFSFGNKYIVLLGIKTAFIKSHIPAYLAIKAGLNEWFSYIKIYDLIHIDLSAQLFILFENLLFSEFNKCGVIFFNTYLKDLYEAAFIENLKVSEFVAKRFNVFNQVRQCNNFNPTFFSPTDSYNEFTIIKIWALFCKLYKLSIKGDVVLDKTGGMLGKYPQYLVDEFYYICRYIMIKFLPFNFYNLDPVFLSIKYMDKAKKLVAENSGLLNFENNGI